MARSSIEGRLLKNRVIVQRGQWDCWEWAGSRTKQGYGQVSHQGRTRGSHCVSYEVWVGPIPTGLEVHHRCGNPACFNPQHLKAETQAVNNLLSNSASARNYRKTHCIHGHGLFGDNLYIQARRRVCKTCQNDRKTVYRARGERL